MRGRLLKVGRKKATGPTPYRLSGGGDFFYFMLLTGIKRGASGVVSQGRYPKLFLSAQSDLCEHGYTIARQPRSSSARQIPMPLFDNSSFSTLNSQRDCATKACDDGVLRYLQTVTPDRRGRRGSEPEPVLCFIHPDLLHPLLYILHKISPRRDF